AWKCGLLDPIWWMVSLTFPPTKRCGSGKLCTPLERMHWENASRPFCVVADVVVAAVVDDATFATLGERPPPQPAARSENATTVTAALRMSGRRFMGDPFRRFAGPRLAKVALRGWQAGARRSRR